MSKSNKQILQNALTEQPDPSKWSFWLKLLIAVLSAILGVIGENQLDIVNNLINIL